MADNISEALELLGLYIERLGEQVGGVGEVAEFCERAEGILTQLHGDTSENAQLFASAAEEAKACIGRLAAAKAGLEQMQQTLAGMQ